MMEFHSVKLQPIQVLLYSQVFIYIRICIILTGAGDSLEVLNAVASNKDDHCYSGKNGEPQHPFGAEGAGSAADDLGDAASIFDAHGVRPQHHSSSAFSFLLCFHSNAKTYPNSRRYIFWSPL